MSNLTNILKKEVRELLTKQMILSIVFMVFFFVILGNVIGGVTEKAAGDEVKVAVLDLDSTVESKDMIDMLAEHGDVTIKKLSLGDSVENSLGLTSTGFLVGIGLTFGLAVSIFPIVLD